jgi:hypothetical protein
LPTPYPYTEPTATPSPTRVGDPRAASGQTITILLGPYEFQVSASYSAGHVLTEEEARAFNEWRARGIAGNMRDRVNAASRGFRSSGELALG